MKVGINTCFFYIKEYFHVSPSPGDLSTEPAPPLDPVEVPIISSNNVAPTSSKTDHNSVITSQPLLRKSTSDTKPPVWLKGFLYPIKENAACSYPMFNFINYFFLSFGRQLFLAVVSSEVKPAFYE